MFFSHYAGSSRKHRESHSAEEGLCCSRITNGARQEAVLGTRTTPITWVLLCMADSLPTASRQAISPHPQLGTSCTLTKPLRANLTGNPYTYGTAHSKWMLKYQYPLRAHRRSHHCSLPPGCFPNRNKLTVSELKMIPIIRKR